MIRQGSEDRPQMEDLRREEMLMPDEVAAMVGLRGLGWGAKRIAGPFGCSRNTVKRYLGLGGWTRCLQAGAGEGAGRARGLAGADGSGSIAATPMWCDRNCWPSTGSR